MPLVDDLRDVSRITRGKIELHEERVDLATIVNQAVETVRHLVEARGLDHHLVKPVSRATLQALIPA
ncbi:hypothetical protein WMF38_51100 [Sorangium sp. So ce118]